MEVTPALRISVDRDGHAAQTARRNSYISGRVDGWCCVATRMAFRLDMVGMVCRRLSVRESAAGSGSGGGAKDDTETTRGPSSSESDPASKVCFPIVGAALGGDWLSEPKGTEFTIAITMWEVQAVWNPKGGQKH